jgi:hypothetical protein
MMMVGSYLRSVALLLPIVLIGTAAGVRGDDTPTTMCLSISSLGTSVRTWDLSSLSPNQQSNVGYYLNELARKSIKPPPQLWIMRDQALRFSLIFPHYRCDDVCKGVAILPDATGFRILEFSYRRNLVMRPSRSQRTGMTSLILFDAKGKSLWSFHDLYEKANPDRDGEPSMGYVRSEHTPIAREKLGSDRTNYLACLQNLFDVDSAMPGSGAN